MNAIKVNADIGTRTVEIDFGDGREPQLFALPRGYDPRRDQGKRLVEFVAGCLNGDLFRDRGFRRMGGDDG